MQKTIISDDIYSSVKSFAFKGRILSYQNLENLAESRDLEDLVTKLRGTVYSQAVSKVQKPYKADRLELAFKEHLYYSHHLITKVAPMKNLLEAYYLKHIGSNLKTVLKGKALGVPYEELAGHVDLFAEELAGRRDIVVRALTAPSLNDAVNQLAGSEFGPEAEAAAKRYAEKPQPQIFDLHIDKATYSNLAKAYDSAAKGRLAQEAPRIRPLMAVTLDHYNVLSLLRAKLWDLSKPETRGLIVESGLGVPTNLLEEMAGSESAGEALKVLEKTEYRRIVPKAAQMHEALAKLEAGFTVLLQERARKAFLWNEFGVSLALAAMSLMEIEVRNLSAIAFGVEQRLGVQRVMEKLVLSK